MLLGSNVVNICHCKTDEKCTNEHLCFPDVGGFQGHALTVHSLVGCNAVILSKLATLYSVNGYKVLMVSIGQDMVVLTKMCHA